MSRKTNRDSEYIKKIFKLFSLKHTERVFNYIIEHEPCMAQNMIFDLELASKILHFYLNRLKEFDLIGQKYDRRYIVTQRGHGIKKWIETVYNLIP